ncbi:ribosomal protection-like ABC-F family protein [Fredinandcohnia sp. 179-A 10B2 NHS]|uniref:ribosomal protection-like ABC-F family protein n=1 Tax=Fredinandcohnia sp. 179-A 10B2 NHS TaxID=3235176 RepID=UPI0039A16205
MTTIMKIRGVQKSFGDRVILQNIDLDIRKRDRIGIVGSNGAGKTTLANILSGVLSVDSGSIEMNNVNTRIGYLVQSTDSYFYSQDETYDSNLLEKTSNLGLKKVQEWDNSKVYHLSGGERTKLTLAHIWSGNPELLILDEPTNHLDFKGINWLIEQLEVFSGGVIIISHDRYFLDKTVKQIIEIEDGAATRFKGNYSIYQAEKEKRYQSQLHQYSTQQKYKEKIEQQMNTLQNWSDKAHRQSTKQEGFKEFYRVKAKKMDKQIKSKMKRLENELEKHKIEKPKEQQDLQFYFQDSQKRGKRVIEARNCRKGYPDKTLFQNSHFYIKHGERIGIVGENGCGKTTLLRIILGDEELTEGELWKSNSIKLGYLSQDVTDLDKNKTALEYMDITDRDEISRVRTLFANIGLKEDKMNVPLTFLSLGERTRIKLVKMLVDEVDVLILDEPTNHLDLQSRETLENTLQEFRGTILAVSHDTYFLQKICEKLLVFENKRINRVEMSPQEFLNEGPKKPAIEKEEELLLLDNEISVLIGQLSLLAKEGPTYQELDAKLIEKMRRKRELLG